MKATISNYDIDLSSSAFNCLFMDDSCFLKTILINVSYIFYHFEILSKEKGKSHPSFFFFFPLVFL